MLTVALVAILLITSGSLVTSSGKPSIDPYAEQMAGSTLSGEEVRANECLNPYGVRIDRSKGTFELRGDILALQDAYLDRECRAQIAPGVAEKIRLFQLGLNRQANACLRERGYPVPDKDDQLYFEGIPPEVQNSCLNGVYARYRD